MPFSPPTITPTDALMAWPVWARVLLGVPLTLVGVAPWLCFWQRRRLFGD